MTMSTAKLLVKVALVHPVGVSEGGSEAGVAKAVSAQKLPAGVVDRLDGEHAHGHPPKVERAEDGRLGALDVEHEEIDGIDAMREEQRRERPDR